MIEKAVLEKLYLGKKLSVAEVAAELGTTFPKKRLTPKERELFLWGLAIYWAEGSRKVRFNTQVVSLRNCDGLCQQHQAQGVDGSAT